MSTFWEGYKDPKYDMCMVIKAMRNNFIKKKNLVSLSLSLPFCMGMFLGKTLQRPSLILENPRKDMNNMSCCHDITEILLKAA